MESHGFANYDMNGLTFTDQMGLVGRGMSAVSLAVVLAPVLKALGFFREFSSSV